MGSPIKGDFRSLPASAWGVLHSRFVASNQDSLSELSATSSHFTVTSDRSTGDCIYEVNGVRGAVCLIHQCRKLQVLNLKVSRQDSRSPFKVPAPLTDVSDGDNQHYKSPSPAPFRPVVISPAASPNKFALSNWPYSPDLAFINEAVAQSPMTLAEAYGDMTSPVSRSSTTLFRGRHVFSSFRFPSSWKGVRSRAHKWTFSGSASRTHVKQGAQFVKSKTKGVMSKTRKRLANIQAMPSQKSVTDIVEYVKDHAESAHVPEKAQKGLDYIKEQAVIASSMISERVAQTAQKGIKIVKNLGRAGGA